MPDTALPRLATQPTPWTFSLPDLGEGLSGADVTDWLVSPGDEVELDQPIVVVETVKTTIEVPSPCRGQVLTLHCDAPASVVVGAPLVTFLVPEGAPLPVEETPAPAHTEDVVTHLVGQRPLGLDDLAAGSLPAAAALPRKPEGARTATSPAVRRLARDLRVDLSAVQPSGKGGVITRDDVLAAAGLSGEGA